MLKFVLEFETPTVPNLSYTAPDSTTLKK